MQITIRDAAHGDRDIVARFNIDLAQETESISLDPEVVSKGVARVLDDPSLGRYFIAQDDAGRVVGQLMITFEWSDWRNGMIWWIQSVFVESDARRQGVFRALHSHVDELARRTDGVRGLRLYVEHENHAAQRTYEGLGMRNAGYLVHEDIWM